MKKILLWNFIILTLSFRQIVIFIAATKFISILIFSKEHSTLSMFTDYITPNYNF